MQVIALDRATQKNSRRTHHGDSNKKGRVLHSAHRAGDALKPIISGNPPYSTKAKNSRKNATEPLERVSFCARNRHGWRT